MEFIDNGDIHIDNIAYKIKMIKELIEQLKKERNGITKEIQRIQIRLNNYNNKYDLWKSLKDVNLIKSSNADPLAAALRE